MEPMSSENSKRRTRPTGPSTTADGRDPMEVWEEQQEALRNMTPEELSAFMTAAADQSRAEDAECREEAARRRSERYMAN